jgi:hypothetical protein
MDRSGDTTESEDIGYIENEPPNPFFIPFEIHIHEPGGTGGQHLFDLIVYHSTSGGKLHDLIFQRLGRPFRMFIIRDGHEIYIPEDDQQLHSFDIKANSIIYTVLSLRIPEPHEVGAAAEPESSRESEDSGYERSSESSRSSRSEPYFSESEGYETDPPQRSRSPSPFRPQGGTRKYKRFKKSNTYRKLSKRKSRRKPKRTIQMKPKRTRKKVRQQTLYHK